MACEALETAYQIAVVQAEYDAVVYELEQAEADVAYNAMLASSWAEWNAWYAWQECLAQQNGGGGSSSAVGPEQPTSESRPVVDVKAIRKKRNSIRRRLKTLQKRLNSELA